MSCNQNFNMTFSSCLWYLSLNFFFFVVDVKNGQKSFVGTRSWSLGIAHVGILVQTWKHCTDGIVGNEHQKFCFVDHCNVLEALHIELLDFRFFFIGACSRSLTLLSEISSNFGAKDVSCFWSFHTCSVGAWLVISYSFEEVSNIFLH